MIIVLGATGRVGSAVAHSLLDHGERVTVVTRSGEKAAPWRERGAEVALTDVGDPDRLREVFRNGKRAFLLNPPAAPSTDTDREEHRTVDGIVRALVGSGLEKVVVQSTYGARSGERVGDLSVLHDFEQALAAQPIPVTILRAAYYMSNWDPLLAAARGGVLPTLFPADLRLPMVASSDLGRVAARLLREPVHRTGVHHVEGPHRYSSADVAQAFAVALARPVRVTVTPRERWVDDFRQKGFSEPAALSYARMTSVTVDGTCTLPDDPERGSVTLRAYIERLVAGQDAGAEWVHP